MAQTLEIVARGRVQTQAATTLRRTGQRPVVSSTIPSVLRAKLLEDAPLMFRSIAHEDLRIRNWRGSTSGRYASMSGAAAMQVSIMKMSPASPQ
jgi:hypothetical protein